MLKKVLLIIVVCLSIIPFVGFTSQQATLYVINQTIVRTGFPSVAHIHLMAYINLTGENYKICSHGYIQAGCPNDLAINVSADRPIYIDIQRWEFGDRRHDVEKSCQDQILVLKPGETRAFVIRGLPSNSIGDQSKIVCSIV